MRYTLVRSAWSQEPGFLREEADDHAASWEPPTPEERAAHDAAFTPADEANLVRGNLYVVVDGVGALATGELVSRRAAEGIVASHAASDEPDPAAALASALAEVNRTMYESAPAGPGTLATSCACAVLRGPELYVAHLGNTRAYLLRQGRLAQLTEDYPAEAGISSDPSASGEYRARAKRGTSTRSESRRRLGDRAELAGEDVIRGPIPIEAGDRLLLCSDGLWGPLSGKSIEGFLALGDDVRACAQRLVQMALHNNGPDNATALVIEVVAFGVRQRQLPPPVAADSVRDPPAAGGPLTHLEATQTPGAAAAAPGDLGEGSGGASATAASQEPVPHGEPWVAAATGLVEHSSAPGGAEVNQEPIYRHEEKVAFSDWTPDLTPITPDWLTRTQPKAGVRQHIRAVLGLLVLVAGAFVVGMLAVGALRSAPAMPSDTPTALAIPPSWLYQGDAARFLDLLASDRLQEGLAPGEYRDFLFLVARAVVADPSEGERAGVALDAFSRRAGAGLRVALERLRTGDPAEAAAIDRLLAAARPAAGRGTTPAASVGTSPQSTGTARPSTGPQPSPSPGPTASAEPTGMPLSTASPQPTPTPVGTATPLPALSPAPSAPPAPTPPRTEPLVSCFMRVDQPGSGPFAPGIRLRPGPSRESGDLGAIPDGTRLEWTRQRILGSDEQGPIEWYEVRVDTRVGWVSSRYLSPVGC